MKFVLEPYKYHNVDLKQRGGLFKAFANHDAGLCIGSSNAVHQAFIDNVLHHKIGSR